MCVVCVLKVFVCINSCFLFERMVFSPSGNKNRHIKTHKRACVEKARRRTTVHFAENVKSAPILTGFTRETDYLLKLQKKAAPRPFSRFTSLGRRQQKKKLNLFSEAYFCELSSVLPGF